MSGGVDRDQIEIVRRQVAICGRVVDHSARREYRKMGKVAMQGEFSMRVMLRLIRRGNGSKNLGIGRMHRQN